MTKLKYTVIKSRKQYYEYCRILHDFDFSKKKKTKAMRDEMELLLALIEKHDEEENIFQELDPVQLLKSIMRNHKMQAKELADLLGVTKGYVSGILNYKKGFSKNVTRKLAERFKVRQDAFNRPYELVGLRKKKAA
jgi:HTH-type transcriptional regulator/antitoxin HigA